MERGRERLGWWRVLEEEDMWVEAQVSKYHSAELGGVATSVDCRAV
jgi:hypothetical protein